MKRFSSQFIFCSPQHILSRSVIEQNEDCKITRIFSLDESIAESAQTLFYNGIISSEIVSIKQSLSDKVIDNIKDDYHYLDLSDEISISQFETSLKPLILDFGTNNIAEINRKLSLLAPIFDSISINEIIASLTFYPALLAGKTNIIQENNSSHLLLWESIDLTDSKLTLNSHIRFLS